MPPLKRKRTLANFQVREKVWLARKTKWLRSDGKRNATPPNLDVVAFLRRYVPRDVAWLISQYLFAVIREDGKNVWISVRFPDPDSVANIVLPTPREPYQGIEVVIPALSLAMFDRAVVESVRLDPHVHLGVSMASHAWRLSLFYGNAPEFQQWLHAFVRTGHLSLLRECMLRISFDSWGKQAALQTVRKPIATFCQRFYDPSRPEFRALCEHKAVLCCRQRHWDMMPFERKLSLLARDYDRARETGELLPDLFISASVVG